MEAMTDMQIRDLIAFNRKIEEVQISLFRITLFSNNLKEKCQPVGIEIVFSVYFPPNPWNPSSHESISSSTKFKMASKVETSKNHPESPLKQPHPSIAPKTYPLDHYSETVPSNSHNKNSLFE